MVKYGRLNTCVIFRGPPNYSDMHKASRTDRIVKAMTSEKSSQF